MATAHRPPSLELSFDDHPLSYPLSCTSGPPILPPLELSIWETSWFDDSDCAPSLCTATTAPSEERCLTPSVLPDKAAALLDICVAPKHFTEKDWFAQVPPPGDVLPDPEVLASIAGYTVYDIAGRERLFTDLFPAQGRHLLIFVRHFFCPACRAYLWALATGLATSTTRSVAVSVIGPGAPDLIRYYKAAAGCSWPVYADPGRGLFRAFGMKSAFTGGLKTPAYMKGISRARWIVESGKGMWAQESWDKMTCGGNVFQVGGEVLIENGEVVWCHRMRNMRDHTEVDVVKKVLEIK